LFASATRSKDHGIFICDQEGFVKKNLMSVVRKVKWIFIRYYTVIIWYNDCIGYQVRKRIEQKFIFKAAPNKSLLYNTEYTG
jgi:CDP-diglyceride synthetase